MEPTSHSGDDDHDPNHDDHHDPDCDENGQEEDIMISSGIKLDNTQQQQGEIFLVVDAILSSSICLAVPALKQPSDAALQPKNFSLCYFTYIKGGKPGKSVPYEKLGRPYMQAAGLG